ncbi:MAG: amidohydrolase family protein [Pirellulales bacterium]|nr:amidohydrolase family protein [Pirellulales bacterium]
MRSFLRLVFLVVLLLPAFVLFARAGDTKDTEVYARIKAYLDTVRGIDTHTHLIDPHTAERVRQQYDMENPPTCALERTWRVSYLTWAHPLAPWSKDRKFDTWWKVAEPQLRNYRARSAYRSMLPLYTDLYGVDFDTLTLDQARALNERMEKNYKRPDWPEEVLLRRANTELFVVDAFSLMPRPKDNTFPFQTYVCNVQRVINGFHPSETKRFPLADPYAFAAERKIPVKTLDDYVALLDRILAEAKKAGAVGLKSPNAYERTLKYVWTPKHLAEQAFGKPRKELTPAQIKAFQDYVFWRLAELSAKHELPFQIHTGHAKIPDSNPMNLVPVIQANPKTRFILFHGGFPWVSEVGMVALKYPNVYLDSVWMPTLSYTLGKRGYKEWLDMISSNRIMWGSDLFTIEGTYGATRYARQCIAEALAEKVLDKELREEDARRIGRQILRENALEALPLLKKHLKSPAETPKPST